ncbi:MAG: hypothetical protein E7Z86_09665 [Methanosphaera stadtmanae]|jgi:hypothetical protein|nr:hypothetical protein [Methanosphaera stadtmanae]
MLSFILRLTGGETVKISSLECKTEIKNFLTVMKTTTEEYVSFQSKKINIILSNYLEIFK